MPNPIKPAKRKKSPLFTLESVNSIVCDDPPWLISPPSELVTKTVCFEAQDFYWGGTITGFKYEKEGLTFSVNGPTVQGKRVVELLWAIVRPRSTDNKYGWMLVSKTDTGVTILFTGKAVFMVP